MKAASTVMRQLGQKRDCISLLSSSLLEVLMTVGKQGWTQSAFHTRPPALRWSDGPGWLGQSQVSQHPEVQVFSNSFLRLLSLSPAAVLGVDGVPKILYVGSVRWRQTRTCSLSHSSMAGTSLHSHLTSHLCMESMFTTWSSEENGS